MRGGIAYATAVDEFEKHTGVHSCGANRDVRCFRGTSVGAIAALMCCCHFTTSEMVSATQYATAENVLGASLASIAWRTGFDSGAKLRGWLSTLMGAKLGIDPYVASQVSLEELRTMTGGTLIVYATNLVRGEYMEIGPDTHPHIPAILAVYASAALPPVYVPVHNIPMPTGEATVLCDGGLTLNYPYLQGRIDCASTIGFAVRWSASSTDSLSSFQNYFSRVLNVAAGSGDEHLRKAMPKRMRDNTCVIDVGDVSVANFWIPKERADVIRACSRKCTHDWVQGWMPNNNNQHMRPIHVLLHRGRPQIPTSNGATAAMVAAKMAVAACGAACGAAERSQTNSRREENRDGHHSTDE